MFESMLNFSLPSEEFLQVSDCAEQWCNEAGLDPQHP
jgi:hypothetical protein